MVRLRRVLIASGVVLAIGLVVVMTLTAEPFQPNGYGPGQDARAYWAVPLSDPYTPGSVGHESAYLYSPAFLEALAPIRLLTWPVFLAVWTTLLLVVLRWMSGAAAVRAAHRAHVPGAVGRQHHHPARRDDRGRLPASGCLGVRAADQGDPGRGPAVVRGATGMASTGRGGRRDRGHRGRVAAHRAPAVAGVARPARLAARAPAPSRARCRSRCCSGCPWP